MRSQVYSWRLSSELKSDLERAARLKKVPASAILELAVRDWLQKARTDTADDEVRSALQAEVASCLGVLAGRNPRLAENARVLVRKRLAMPRAKPRAR